MTAITLSVDGKSINFSLDDLANIEAVLLGAARRPGQEIFRSTSSGRVSALLEGGSVKAGQASSARTSGAHHFSEANSSPELTDC